MISVLILTHNEELDLPGCLQSVSWSDDIHVFDSYSTDTTIEIARAAGAHVHQRVFDDYAAQRNASLQIDFSHPWVLVLDADERPTEALCRELRRAVGIAPEGLGGFRMRRRDYLFGVWLKHAQLSPFYVRVIRPERSRYTRAVNEVIEISGSIGDLHEPLDHFPFSKGLGHWIAKHNIYSTIEADLIVNRRGLQGPSWRKAALDKNFETRRLHQKAIFYRLPCRPLLKWFYLVFVRRAFLDGSAGLTYATLQAIYEYFIVLKVREFQRTNHKH